MLRPETLKRVCALISASISPRARRSVSIKVLSEGRRSTRRGAGDADAGEADIVEIGEADALYRRALDIGRAARRRRFRGGGAEQRGLGQRAGVFEQIADGDDGGGDGDLALERGGGPAAPLARRARAAARAKRFIIQLLSASGSWPAASRRRRR